MWFSSKKSHKSLLSDVYPSASEENSGEISAKPNALSLVIFYASSKPQKIPKIGAFLEGKVIEDIRRLHLKYV